MRLCQSVALGLCCLAFFVANNAGARADKLIFDAAGDPQFWDYTTMDWVGAYGVRSAWIDGCDAHFIGAPGVVTVSGSINSVNSLTFLGSNYILSGGTITLTGSGGWISTQSGGTNTIGSVIAGSVGLTKDGSGTLILNGANTFTGDTAIDSGTLKLGNANALQYSTLDYSSNGMLTFGSSSNAALGGLKGNHPLLLRNDASGAVTLTVGGNDQSTTFGGIIIGTTGSALRKVGCGTLTLSGSNSCDTILSGGTIQFGNATALQQSVVTADGGALTCGPFSNVVLGGLKGSGNLSLDSVRLDVGFLGQSTAYDGVLSGTMSLSKVGAGTLTLNGQNTFSGDTTITGGTLMLGAANALQNSTLDPGFDGLLNFGSLINATLGGLKGSGRLSLVNNFPMPVTLTVGGNNQSTTYSGGITGSYQSNVPTSALKKVGAGTLTLSGSLQNFEMILSSGAIQLGTANALQYVSVNLDGGTLNCGPFTVVPLGGLKGNGNLSLDGVRLDAGYIGISTAYDGVLSGTMALNKTGSGTLTLNGENTFSGDTVITGGTLMLGTANALQNSTLDYSGGGTIGFGLLSDATVGGLKGNRLLMLANLLGTPFTLSVGANNQSTTYTGNITGPQGSAIAAALRKVGSGTLVLSGSIQGCDTILSGGTLQLGISSALQNSTVVPDGGTLDCGPFTAVALAGLKGSGNLSLNGVRLDVGGPGQSMTYQGVLGGTMALCKTGGGTLTLARENTFSGDTTITGGMLLLGTANALQNSILDYSSNGTIGFGLLGNASLGGLKGSRSLTLMNLTSAPIALTVGGNNQSTTYSGGVTGPLGCALKKVGSGTLTLSGSNQCNLILSGGSLQLGSQGALQNSLLTPDGGTLNCWPITIVPLGGLAGSGNLALDGVRLDVGYLGQSTSYDGVLSGSMSLNKTGSSTLTLDGENTFSGSTTISGGAIFLGTPNALRNSTLTSSPYGGLRFGTLTSATLGGLQGNVGLLLTNDVGQYVELSVGANNQSTTFTGSVEPTKGGALKKVGSGTLTFAGSIPCDTIIAAGTLQLSSNPYALSNSTVEMAGGSLSCGPLTYAVLGGLRGSGNLSLGNARLEVGYTSSSTSYDGILSGAMSLTKSGSGTLTLNGENTFSGTTTITGGTLKLGTPNALQNSTLDYNSSGTLKFGSLTDATLGALSGSRPLILANDYSQAVQITVGGNGRPTGFAGPLYGPGGLTKVGNSVLTLSYYDNYLGRTTVKSGTLNLLGQDLSKPGGWHPVLDLGGADIQGGKITFQYLDQPSDPKDTIASLLAASYHGGAWDVGQFRSSTAAALGLSLGWADDGTAVTVMATIPGDFNLDGVVNDLDRDVWFANAFSGTSWRQGDANYDGVVDGLDRDIWFANAGRAIESIQPGAPTVEVPEPGTLSLLTLALLGMSFYASRRR
jgi:fibronectin-binding autotransporter adhesin